MSWRVTVWWISIMVFIVVLVLIIAWVYMRHTPVACQSNSDCPSGQVCDTNAGSCISSCTPGNCPSGYTCNTTSGVCEIAVSPSGFSYISNSQELFLSWTFQQNSYLSVSCSDEIIEIFTGTYKMNLGITYTSSNNPATAVVQFSDTPPTNCDDYSSVLNSNTDLVSTQLPTASTAQTLNISLNITVNSTFGIMRIFFQGYVLGQTNISSIVLSIISAVS